MPRHDHHPHGHHPHGHHPHGHDAPPPPRHHGFTPHGSRPFPTAEDAETFEALLGPDQGRAATRLLSDAPPEIATLGALIAALYRRLVAETVPLPHEDESHGDGHDVPAHIEDD